MIGHTHFVIEALPALDTTAPTDPRAFAFFRGVDTPADAGGRVSVPVARGLPAGAYRLSSANAAANHQPVLVNVAQRGALDDAVYVRFAVRCGAVRGLTFVVRGAVYGGWRREWR